jgi:hypothetical protein
MSAVDVEFDPAHFDVWYSQRAIGLVDALERYRGCYAGRLYSGTVAKAYNTYANWSATQDPTDWLKAGMLSARPPIAYGKSSEEFWSTELSKVFRRR